MGLVHWVQNKSHCRSSLWEVLWLKRKAIDIVRVGVSFGEDQCGYQEMDFIMKTKYQEGRLLLLDELDNTEEKIWTSGAWCTLIYPSTSQ
jgi:hypothetical protein